MPGDVLPLYKRASGLLPTRGTGGNAGLWYDKFCDSWKPDWSGLVEGGKNEWIAGIADVDDSAAKRVGDAGILSEAAERQAQLVKSRGGQTFRLATAWRFVSGLGRSHPVENGFTWHHALGTPYLPGSGVKGVARAWAERWSGTEADVIARIFGPDKGQAASGSVIFLDALPVKPPALDADVMTPHYGPWYKDGEDPGDWHSPTPIPFLTVARGQSFQFALMPRTSRAAADCERAADLLREALETLGAGAKTAAGYGVFREEAGPATGGAPNAETGSTQSAFRPRADLPSGSLVRATLLEKNNKDKWRALHEASGASAVIDGHAPDACEKGQVHELYCRTKTNFDWPTDKLRQRLSNPPRQSGSRPAGKGRGGNRR